MKLGIIAATIALAACSGPSPQPPVPPLPPPLHPPTMQSCDLAQETLIRLDCRRDDGSSWAKTPVGAPFADACKRALADGRSWSSNCIARITDCSMLMPAYRGEWCGAVDGGE